MTIKQNDRIRITTGDQRGRQGRVICTQAGKGTVWVTAVDDNERGFMVAADVVAVVEGK